MPLRAFLESAADCFTADCWLHHLPISKAEDFQMHQTYQRGRGNPTTSFTLLRRLIPLFGMLLLVTSIAGVSLRSSAQARALGLHWLATFSNLWHNGIEDRKVRLAPADAVGDFRTAASGNWDAIATWETFNGTSWVSAVATPTSADGVITIRSGHTVTISASGLTYDQVAVDAGGQVTVAPTITSTLANGAGTDLAINGTWLNQGGAWTTTGTWTAGPSGTYIHNTTSGIATPLGQATLDAASNFIYRGSSTLAPAVSTANRTYGNLSFESTAGAWSLTASGTTPLTVNGDFTIGSGVTYSTTQTGVMTFAGSFTNNGTLTNSTGTQIYTFTGSGKTIGGSGAISFETFNVNNGALITLTANVSVSGTLTLTSGNVTTGINTLTLGSAATLSGGSSSSFVVGNLKKSAVPAAFSFPVGVAAIAGHAAGYTPVDLANASGGGDLTVTTNHAVQPVLNTGTTLNEYWSLSSAGTLTTDLTFHYLDTDVNGTEANYQLIIVSGGNATRFPGTVDAGANTITMTGVQEFSDWTAGEPAAPTAVKLTGFTATQNNGEVVLQWQTGYEARNLGYNIYREQDGKRVAVTPSLIAGSALIAGRQTRLTAGLNYSWHDQTGQNAAGSNKTDVAGAFSYWLEDVDINGTRTLHGPIIPSLDYTRKKERNAQAELLSELSQRTVQSGVRLSSWPAEYAAARSGKNENAATIDPIDVQRQLAGLPGVKIAISKPGWYRVTNAELQAAGLDTREAGLLQLYVNGLEVPIRLSGDGLEFTANDYLEFFGQGSNSPTDAVQTYYLVIGKGGGKRVHDRRATGSSEPSGLQSFAYTVERKERMIYFSGLLNGDKENFFGQVVSTTPGSANIPATHLDQTSFAPTRLEIALQGVTTQAHLVRVSFNGTDLGAISFANTDHPRQTFVVPASALHEGDNAVELTSLGGAADVSLVDTLRLTYAHSFTADNNALSFAVSNQQTVRVDGFSNQNIRVVDTTDPYNIDELKPAITELKSDNYAADIQVPGAAFRRPHRVLVFTDEQAAPAERLTANVASSWWSQTAGADYLIITRGDLITSLEPLVQLRRNQGMVVRVVDVEDLYDEFSFGQHSPQAIHDFLQRAMGAWTRQPCYLLLAGDASYDPKNYLGQGMNDLVPTRLIDTALTETASDDWLADFNGDGIADLAVGRLPIRTPADANNIVSKIVSYESAAPDPTRGAVLVADAGFEGPSVAVRNMLPGGLPVATINRASADDATIHNQIIAALNQGPQLTNYLGHGSNGVWTGAALLSSNDAPLLTNTTRLSVFTMMTCFNGYFQDAYNDSLAEALLKSPGGAVAVWASTTLTEPAGQNAIDQEFYRVLFHAQTPTLGEAARAAKVVTTDADVRRTWTLFGDPAMRLH
jgi:hypothetical protein